MSQVSDYNSYKNATRRMQDSYDTERTESKNNHENDVKELKEKSEAELQSAKKEYNQRLQAERSQARDEVKRLKEELYDHSGKSTAREFQQQQDMKNTLGRFQDDLKKQTDKRVARIEEQSGGQSIQQQDVANAKVETALAAQKRSHYQELSALENELKQYETGDHDVEAARAQAKAQSIAENEKEYLNDKRRIVDGYDRQISSMKGHQDEMANHYDRELNSVVYDTNSKAQELVKNQKTEFEKIQRDNVMERNRIENAFNAQVKNLDKNQARSTDHLVAQNNETLTKAIANKDQTYQAYLAEKDQKFDMDVQERDTKIKELLTTSDPLKVSPYVVQKIKNASDEKNYRALTEAQSVLDKNLDAEKNRDQADRRALSDKMNAEVSGLHRESRKELDIQSRQFTNSYTDLQNLHETEVASLKEQKRGTSDRMYEKHALELAGAQTAKQDALLEQKDSLTYEKNAAVDNAEQTRREQDREWSMKANELRRTLENKLGEERDQHEKLTTEMRLENDKKLREQDRTSKRALDDRVRAYEHQIKQQELSFKEKERFLTEHYEEELDRMKRTNAHLIQKKS